MNGQQLYERYAELLLTRENCSCDDWRYLSEGDQGVWCALADELSNQCCAE